MKPLYIYTHLGLGDIIICNGLIRHVSKLNPLRQIFLICPQKFITSVSFMVKDISNLKLLIMDDGEAHELLDDMPDNDKIYVGHHNLSSTPSNSFDESFYNQLGIPFKMRWTNFKVERDIERECSLREQLRLTPNEYIFIHDDPSRNFIINPEFIESKTLPRISPSTQYTNNIFDYISILEGAKEIHCIDSCFRLLADSVLPNRDHLYFHIQLLNGLYKSGNTEHDFYIPQSKLTWNII